MLIKSKEVLTSPRLAFALRAVSLLDSDTIYPIISKEPLMKGPDYCADNQVYIDPHWNPDLSIGSTAEVGMLHCIANMWDAFNTLLDDHWARSGELATEIRLFLVEILPSLIYRGVHYRCSEGLNYKDALGVQSYRLIRRFSSYRFKSYRTNSGIYFYKFLCTDDIIIQCPGGQPRLESGIPSGLSPIDTAEISAVIRQQSDIYKDQFLKELGE